jgi:hypothetical protein
VASIVQTIQKDDLSSGSSTFTQSATTTANNRLVLAIASGGIFGGSAVSSISDSAGNTWTQRVSKATASIGQLEIWDTSASASAITSYTVNFFAATGFITQFYELNGSDVIDTTKTNSGTSTAPSTGASAALAATDEIIIGVIGFQSSSATISSTQFTAGTGTQVNRNGSALFWGGATGSKILTGTSAAQTYSGTLSGSSAWVAGEVIYKITSGGGGSDSKFLEFM